MDSESELGDVVTTGSVAPRDKAQLSIATRYVRRRIADCYMKYYIQSRLGAPARSMAHG